MSIDYSLAKELKRSGFPKSEEWIDNGSGFFVDKGELAYEVPTLEELIEACGEDFAMLGQNKECTEWTALGGTKKMYADKTGKGSTTSEAVARLWLSLNKK